MAVLALLAIGVFAVACGGGDDDDDNGGNGATTTTGSADNQETPTKASSNSSDANPSNADEKYVGQICKATLDFLTSIRTIKPEDLQDEAKAADAMKKPFESYVKAMEDADPPKEAKSYHEEALKQLKATLKALQDGDENAFEQLSSTELPDPPGDLSSRLDAAAAKNKDCQETGFNFGQ
jgi:hypothetical protein